MEQLICYCPACRQKLTAQVLKCPSCQLEMKNEFALSPFDYLTSDHQEFLTEFLRARGNMKALQEKDETQSALLDAVKAELENI